MPHQRLDHETNPPPWLLLVDDEQSFAEALAFRLDARELPCLVAHRGDEALRLLDRPELEVVLLDLNMPGLHGLEALTRIKAKRPDVEVILLTGDANFNSAAHGMRRGASDYLIKPVDFDALLDSIAKARVRSREHKERMRASEAGKLLALGVLAAGIGHELNNPLQIILQRSEWLCELLDDALAGRADFAEMQRTADIIREQAQRSGGITAQLLELSAKTRSSTAETDVAALLEKICGHMGEHLRSLGIALSLRVDPDLPLLPCSPAELEPVFVPLVRNAIDAIEALALKGQATAEGEQTGFHADKQAEPLPAQDGHRRIEISARRCGPLVRVIVGDSGEGVAPEHLPRIFEPFFSTRPVGKGTGMGLTVCHSIVTALRGSVRHMPGTEGGAIFVVEIPAEGENTRSRPESSLPLENDKETA